METFNSILEKCRSIWFDPIKREKIRKREGMFTESEIETIENTIYWIKREKGNIKEKVMYIAHEIFEPLKCPITNELISTLNPLYRKYSDEMIKNKCFIHSKKISNCLIDPFFENYSKEDLDTILKKIPNNVAIRYPMILNHCWISIKNIGIDLKQVESNEEAFYIYTKNLKEIPLCSISGKKRKFSIKSMKYLEFNSKKESHVSNGIKNKGKTISPETIDKRKNTMIKKYGVSCSFEFQNVREMSLETRRRNSEEKKKLKLKDVRTSKEKWLDTIKNKYNVSSYKEFLHSKQNYKEIIQKQKNTLKISLKKKYGVEYISQIPKIREKIKNTCIQKYGSNCALNSEKEKNNRKLFKRIETYDNFYRFKSECIPLFTLDEWLEGYDKKLPWKKTDTGEIYYCRYWGYAPIGKFKDSSLERTVCSMLDVLNIKYLKNVRDVISPMELDIFLPDYNIAIECNGEYFHSSRTKPKNYHFKKYLECNKLGIKLINLFGRTIKENEKKIFNLIKTFTIGNKIKIAARKCILVEISNQIAKSFFEKYHIQGFCNSKKHFGLLYKNRLISATSIGNARFFKNNNDLEIIRYATMRNISVVGGFSKFLSHFKHVYKNKILHTYSDLNFFDGIVYQKSGFIFNKITEPDFYYTKGGNVFLSRYQAQKHKLKKLLGDIFDKNKTEEENMNMYGYYRVYGCGNKHFYLNL